MRFSTNGGFNLQKAVFQGDSKQIEVDRRDGFDLKLGLFATFG